MEVGLPRYGIGSFSSREATEAAVKALQNSSFSMEHVSVIAKEVDDQDQDIVTSEEDFTRQRTIEGVTKGGLAAGTIGGITGVLIGLGALVLPGVGPIAVIGAKSTLVGMAAGSFYGAAAGSIMGAVLGNGVSQEQAKHYSDRLAQGDYLIVIEASEAEIHQAGSLLQVQGIENWGIYQNPG
jgi:hypothetical protein